MSRSLKAGTGVLVALVLAFGVWWGFLRGASSSSDVFTSVVPAVRTAPLRPPQYAAEQSYDQDLASPGIVVRRGDRSRRVAGAQMGVWLDDGRYLTARTASRSGCTPPATQGCDIFVPAVLDPASGRTTALPGRAPFDFLEFPGEALHRVTLPLSRETGDVPVTALTSFSPDLASSEVLRLPQYSGGSRGIERNTGRRVFSIGEWDYVSYNDNDGEDRTESYGYLRRKVGTDHWEQVLVNQRLVALWVSSDGRALLGLQQVKGEPCGGCSKAQQIVEIDPAAARIVRTYGAPGTYDKSWRVGQIDKAGGRVLVRYFTYDENSVKNLGTWSYDGRWRLVEGTDKLFTWWQGRHDRIEARPTSGPESAPVLCALFWVHDGTRTRLPGVVAAQDLPGYRGVPGSLVPQS